MTTRQTYPLREDVLHSGGISPRALFAAATASIRVLLFVSGGAIAGSDCNFAFDSPPGRPLAGAGRRRGQVSGSNRRIRGSGCVTGGSRRRGEGSCNGCCTCFSGFRGHPLLRGGGRGGGRSGGAGARLARVGEDLDRSPDSFKEVGGDDSGDGFVCFLFDVVGWHKDRSLRGFGTGPRCKLTGIREGIVLIEALEFSSIRANLTC